MSCCCVSQAEVIPAAPKPFVHGDKFTGNGSDVPEELYKAMNCATDSKILYWSRSDPAEHMCLGICCKRLDVAVCDPSQTLALVLSAGMSITCASWCASTDANSTYVVLTENDIIIASLQRRSSVCGEPHSHLFYHELDNVREVASGSNDFTFGKDDCICWRVCSPLFVPSFSELRLVTQNPNVHNDQVLGHPVWGHSNFGGFRAMLRDAKLKQQKRRVAASQGSARNGRDSTNDGRKGNRTGTSGALQEKDTQCLRRWLSANNLKAFAEKASARGLTGSMLAQVTDADLREEFPATSFAERKRILALIEGEKRAASRATASMQDEEETEELVLQQTYLRAARKEAAAELGRLAVRSYISAMY